MDAAPPAAAQPRVYNAAHDLLSRHAPAGRAGKPAYIDDHGRHTYAELVAGAARAAGLYRACGVQPEQRVLLCLHDGFALPCMFLGAIQAGVVPVLVNTLLTAADYDYLLADTRARLVVVSEPLAGLFAPLVAARDGVRLIVSGGARDALAAALAETTPCAGFAETVGDEPCFWLYSSGSTGHPKGTVHAHASLAATAECYAGPVLGLGAGDVVFSAAKLFFAYGLGNALSFPLSVGATTVLMAERPTPAAVFARLVEYRASVFFGVPTLYASLLASADAPAPETLGLRLCASAGEALPAELGRRWQARYGVDILDGIGSTEMLHIFLSNRPGAVRYGTSGTPVPGYRARIVDEHGAPVADGELGELQIAGPSAALQYWNQRDKTRKTFLGEWTRTGDKYRCDADGYYVYCGRSDDMLKVGGIYVSPTEVEAALMSHPQVLEAAVVGRADEAGLVKPAAYVVPAPGVVADAALATALQEHVRNALAPYKYPRWIAFVDDLPKTATGKIQRYKLRQTAGPG